MTEPTDAELITRLNEPEYYHAGNFDTPQRAIALLLGLCQEAADALKKQGRPAQAADSVQEDAARMERERICAAIKAEDDCIKIVRGERVPPYFSVGAARKQGEKR